MMPKSPTGNAKDVPTTSAELDFSLVLARVIGSIENDPTQLRNVVYELARIKLEREVWQRHPPLSMAEIRQLIAREKRDSLREEPAPPPCRLSLVAENRRHQLIGTERPCL